MDGSETTATRAEWVCMVAHSGYSNSSGSRCQPGDPHGGWGCGWHFHLMIPAPGEHAIMHYTQPVVTSG